MYFVEKSFDFSAAHYLPKVPPDHPCASIHGHNYRITICYGAYELREGMVVDFNELDAIKHWIDATLDHGRKGTLNDVIENPTSEELCKYIWKNAPHPRQPIDGELRVWIHFVEVKETEKTGARLYDDDRIGY